MSFVARRLWLFGACVLPLAGCAVADLRPGIVRHETPKQIWQKFHGPGVRIRANVVTSNDSRVIEPVVYLSDSADLVIGDIGDDGTMRILYPARPGEQNFGMALAASVVLGLLTVAVMAAVERLRLGSVGTF